jgi:hypothetical protein
MTQTLEQAISASFEAMRTAAAKADRTDYLGNWTAEVMERRPLTFVAVVMEGQTLSWLMPLDDDNDDNALHAGVFGLAADAEVVMRGKALADAVDAISWLVKEATGEGPTTP